MYLDGSTHNVSLELQHLRIAWAYTSVNNINVTYSAAKINNLNHKRNIAEARGKRGEMVIRH